MFSFELRVVGYMGKAETPAWEAVFDIIRYGNLPFTYKSFTPAVAWTPGVQLVVTIV